eukprot:CAMPEP_0117552198 /NCGR_PEP_ID=MMETSP0784-20121206/49582_1 /TAXON_ID=39447 /ORGANISM="" /LENGTH=262 /DNA_ID=CAMNT_0005349259 /DNA_START=133 /DNA_END=918 /DNA_ORIENTATION=-
MIALACNALVIEETSLVALRGLAMTGRPTPRTVITGSAVFRLGKRRPASAVPPTFETPRVSLHTSVSLPVGFALALRVCNTVIALFSIAIVIDETTRVALCSLAMPMACANRIGVLRRIVGRHTWNSFASTVFAAGPTPRVRLHANVPMPIGFAGALRVRDTMVARAFKAFVIDETHLIALRGLASTGRTTLRVAFRGGVVLRLGKGRLASAGPAAIPAPGVRLHADIHIPVGFPLALVICNGMVAFILVAVIIEANCVALW